MHPSAAAPGANPGGSGGVVVGKRKKSKAALNAEKKRSFSLSLSVNFFLIRRGLEVSPFNLNEGKR